MLLMRAATLVFLFLIPLPFPFSMSIPNIIKGRYGRKMLKLFRNLRRKTLTLRKQHSIWIFYNTAEQHLDSDIFEV